MSEVKKVSSVDEFNEMSRIELAEWLLENDERYYTLFTEKERAELHFFAHKTLVKFATSVFKILESGEKVL